MSTAAHTIQQEPCHARGKRANAVSNQREASRDCVRSQRSKLGERFAKD